MNIQASNFMNISSDKSSCVPADTEKLDDLNTPQREAVTAGKGPLLVLAGAGSGKTRVITRRIARLIDLGTPADSILAITFTNKAAGEMARRVRDLCPNGPTWILTFHAMCARILRQHSGRLGYENFSIYDEKDKTACIKRVLKKLSIDPVQFAPGRISRIISNAKNRLEGPDDFEERATGYSDLHIARAYQAYQSMLKEHQALDFDDLLFFTHTLLAEHDEVREELQARFSCILVDEYQDTNHVQYRILRLLAGAHRNICVTGDPDQAIYAWRGADIRNIMEFEKDYPDARVIKLEQNYRSTKTILGAAQGLIRHNSERKEKTLWSDQHTGAPIRILACTDPSHEAGQVADWINELGHNQIEWGDIAVFYRINAQSRQLEATLLERGILYRLAGAVAFYQRKEIKDIMAFLRVLVNPSDTTSLLRVINTPPRGIGKGSIAKLAALAEARKISLMEALPLAEEAGLGPAQQAAIERFCEIMEVLGALCDGPAQAVVEAAIDQTGYAISLQMPTADIQAETANQERLENLHELATAAGQYDEVDERGLMGFLEKAALASDVDQLAEDAQAVTLMTLHAAKGLEFPVVVVIGFEEGMIPHERSIDNPRSIEEERRLCYVGITRAMQKLMITHCRFRQQFGSFRRQIPSSFLREIPEALTKPEDLTGTAWPASSVSSVSSPSSSSTHKGEEKTIQSPSDFWPEEDMSQDPDDALHKGDHVQHPAFGEGVVLAISGFGPKQRITVDFPGMGKKKFLAQYAKFQKI